MCPHVKRRGQNCGGSFNNKEVCEKERMCVLPRYYYTR
nr:MAG TPA: hypothetical protein [Caudoviricetes sp.]